MPTNLSAFDNATTVLEQLSAANTVSDGWLSIFTLFVLTIILFVAIRQVDRYDEVEDLIITLFVMSILSGLMWGFGWIAFERMIIFPVLFLLHLIYYLIQRGER